MNNRLIEFRWLQKVDDDKPLGPPVLQWRYKFQDGSDGEVEIFWNWLPWEDVPVVLVTVDPP